MSRKYPCPKCATGELYDTGSMFMKEVECSNPDCDFYESDGCGCVTADIDD